MILNILNDITFTTDINLKKKLSRNFISAFLACSNRSWATPKRADNFANHGNPFFFNEHEFLLFTYGTVLELLIFDCDLKILSVHVKIMIEMIFAGHKQFAIECVQHLENTL